MISANSGLREAPPTKNPSTSCSLAIRVKKKSEQHECITERKEKLTQFLAIFCGNTTAVNDPDVVGDSRRNRLGEV
jgi:hypothetical protein